MRSSNSHSLGQLNTNEDTVGAPSVPEGVYKNRSEKSSLIDAATL